MKRFTLFKFGCAIYAMLALGWNSSIGQEFRISPSGIALDNRELGALPQIFGLELRDDDSIAGAKCADINPSDQMYERSGCVLMSLIYIKEGFSLKLSAVIEMFDPKKRTLTDLRSTVTRALGQPSHVIDGDPRGHTLWIKPDYVVMVVEGKAQNKSKGTTEYVPKLYLSTPSYIKALEGQ